MKGTNNMCEDTGEVKIGKLKKKINKFLCKNAPGGTSLDDLEQIAISILDLVVHGPAGKPEACATKETLPESVTVFDAGLPKFGAADYKAGVISGLHAATKLTGIVFTWDYGQSDSTAPFGDTVIVRRAE